MTQQTFAQASTPKQVQEARADYICECLKLSLFLAQHPKVWVNNCEGTFTLEVQVHDPKMKEYTFFSFPVIPPNTPHPVHGKSHKARITGIKGTDGVAMDFYNNQDPGALPRYISAVIESDLNMLHVAAGKTKKASAGWRPYNPPEFK
ncbi:MAG: hypothetical protein KGQ41_03255 [Alphaproteobacteria bacterium]|nr:hypothetical protein [Alphaproteobacteria bacterium]